MAQIGARRGATSLTIPLMLGAFVLLAGFLWWLSITAVPTAPPEIVEEDVAEDMIDAQTVDPSSLETGAGGYTGLVVRLEDLNVSTAVGSQAFFVDLPRTPFLVHMAPELIAAGEMLPAQGQSVTVVGEVMEMNDSTVAAWSEAGVISEGDRPLVEFATHYIQAVQIRSSEPAPAGAGG